ncbi:MAG: zinc-ribbon domain-containing protein [Oscillospiraceae bacterium]|nr:zinc-ribbon domain-containing protein [Oscillospiraceae bacterium]
MGESFRQHCQRRGFGFLLAQWDEERNLPLTPDTVTFGSHRKVWWRCDKGHAWQASPDGRKTGAGCPYCAGLRPVPGVNDLATLAPTLASQWHPSYNGTLTPQDVMPGSRRAVWWQCAQGHTWRASPQAVTSGSGCPQCAAARRSAAPHPRPERRGSLAAEYPLLARQWSPRNGDLTPDAVTPGSHRKVWWRCDKGHQWQAVVFSRTGKSAVGCPACSALRRGREGLGDDMMTSA